MKVKELNKYFKNIENYSCQLHGVHSAHQLILEGIKLIIILLWEGKE